jgi:hypothetical protein
MRSEEESKRDFDSGWDRADEVAATVLEGHAQPYEREATVRAAGEIYLVLLENMDKPWAERASLGPKIRALVEDWPQSRLSGGSLESKAAQEEQQEAAPALLASKNPYGRFAIWYFLPISHQVEIMPFRTRADLMGTALVLGARLHRIRTGSFPRGLESLRAYLGSSYFEGDPFTGRPFLFSAAQRKLWSVGHNGVDDGGVGGNSQVANARDYVWSFADLQAAPKPTASVVAPRTGDIVRGFGAGGPVGPLSGDSLNHP